MTTIPRKTQNHPRPNGFTLLEVLVALTLVGLLSTVLFQGLRLSARLQTTASERGDRLLQIATIHASLRNMLSGAEAVVLDPGASPPQPIIFHGQGDRISFVAPLPARIGMGGRHLFTIGMDRDGRMVLRWRLYRPEIPTSASGQAMESQDRTSVLLDHLRAVRFTYFATHDPAEAPAWYGQWDNVRTLPLLIRVEFSFTDGTETPELLIAPRRARASVLANR